MASAYADLAYVYARNETVKNCLSPADVSTALDDAKGFVSLSAYGCRADWAHYCYTMHLLTCRFEDKLGGEQGPVTELSANEISGKFSDVNGGFSESVTGSTKWGRLFEAVCATTLAPYQVG